MGTESGDRLIPVRAMVMAAGAGTRLRPLTQELPKPMVPVANRPVLEYTIENLKRHGIKDIILNLHNHPEMIKKYFGDGSNWGVNLSYSHEAKLMGTAGGVKKASDFLRGGTFIVMSGDGLTDIDLTDLVAFHRKQKSVATMALKDVDSQFEYGVTLTNRQGRITKFVEKPRWSDIFSNHVNTGIYVFEPEIFHYIPAGRISDFGHEIWPKLFSEKKRIFAMPTDRYWCDVGNLAEYRKAQRDMLERKLAFALPGKEIKRGVWVEEGVILESGVTLEGPCLIGRGTRIAKGSRIGAFTMIGREVKIGAGSHIHQSVLWDRSVVGAGVKLENCILGQRARVTDKVSLYDGSIIQTL